MPKLRKQISLGYDAEGKRIRKWISADNETDLRKKEKQLLMNVDSVLQSDTHFGEYAQTWFETYKGNKTDGTRGQYQYALRKLKPLDRKRLKDITRTDVQKIINTFSDRPYAAANIAMTAKQILDAAALDGLIQPKFLKFELPRKGKPEKRPLTKTEKKAALKADLKPQERLFTDIELYLGLRPEETRALQPRDFDLKNRTVTISRAVVYDAAEQPVIKGTKTGVVRTIPVPDVLIAEIRAYNASFRGFYYFVDKQGTLFTYGKYRTFIKRIFKKINEALGGNDKLNLLNGWTLYTFRHNRATELYYLNGVSTKKKAEYMGHSEMMFLKTYSHLDDEKEETELLRKVVTN